MNSDFRRILPPTLLAFLMAGLFTSASGIAAPLLRDTFSGPTPKGTRIATEPDVGFNYWYAPDNRDDSVNGSRSHGWSWGLPNDTVNWVGSFAGSAGPEGQKWLLRNLGNDGTLPAGRAVADPRLSALFNMGWGGNTPNYCYNLALLTPQGNGYVAQIGRAGAVTLYRLDNGLHGHWARIATQETGLQFNTIQIILSVSKGVVSVTSKRVTQQNAPGPGLSATDTAHAKFSAIGLSGLGLAG